MLVDSVIFHSLDHVQRCDQKSTSLSNQVCETWVTIYIIADQQRVLVYRRTCQCNKLFFSFSVSRLVQEMSHQVCIYNLLHWKTSKLNLSSPRNWPCCCFRLTADYFLSNRSQQISQWAKQSGFGKMCFPWHIYPKVNVREKINIHPPVLVLL